ncbi:MAG: nitroreductase family protein [Terracidiphilus sp.]|jgi:nitroreductase
MRFDELILARRSVRKYQTKAVEPEKLQALIEAVRMAPSASNAQPWKLILVDDAAIKERVARATFSKTFSFNQFAMEAPVIAVLAVEKHSMLTQVVGWMKKRPFYLMDIGIAAAQFCLQATELGLGTCMLGWFDEAEVKRILKIPRAVRVALVITVGYEAENRLPRPKVRKPAEVMSSWNGYQ